MKTGLGSVKEAVERAKNSTFTGGYLNYITWKDGESKLLRFLTDDVITVDWYDYVVTKDGKAAGSFPVSTQVGAGEEDFVLKYGGLTKGEGGALVTPTARERTVAIAVVREEVRAEGSSLLVPRDVVEQVEVDGKKYDSLKFGIISQSYRNFWATLVGYVSRYGVITDRDYEIKRIGSDNTTQYTIIPIEPVEGLRSAEEVMKRYGYGEKRPEDDPNRFRYCPMTLPEWIKSMGSETYIKSRLVQSSQAAQTTQTSQTAEEQQAGFNEFKRENSLPPEQSGGLREALINNR